MKKFVSSETPLSYSNYNKPFEIHTDASKKQLGSIISQKDKPIVFCSRELNPIKVNCTIIEQESLFIMETLKEFRYTIRTMN